MSNSKQAAATNNKSFLTVKNILRIMVLLCIIFVFCPVFLVSCSGQKIEMSLIDVLGGMSTTYGDTIVEAQPILIIGIILPILSLIFLFSKKKERRAAVVTCICTVADLVMWLIFKSKAEAAATEEGATFETLGTYTFNIIVLVLIAVISLLVVINKIQLETDIVAMAKGISTNVSGDRSTESPHELPHSVKAEKKALGYCAKCGKAIYTNDMFCAVCGTPVPKELLIVDEEKTPSEFCSSCGSKLKTDAVFCASCGKKVK